MTRHASTPGTGPSLRFAALLFATHLAAPALVAAQDCEEEDELEPLSVTPAAGATGVVRTSPIFVRYSEGYFLDPIVAADPTTSIRVVEESFGASERPVAGNVQVVGDTLIFIPDEPFAERARYRGEAIGFTGNLRFSFSTGSQLEDTTPPGTPSLDDPSSSSAQSCEGSRDAFRINVSFAPVSDDGPEGDIEYQLFLVRGPTVAEPRLVARTRNIATERITMAFLLAREDVVAPICVTVHAVDGVGNVNDQADPACFDPIDGNFFEPLCSVSPRGGRGPASGAGLAACVALGWVLRRRR